MKREYITIEEFESFKREFLPRTVDFVSKISRENAGAETMQYLAEGFVSGLNSELEILFEKQDPDLTFENGLEVSERSDSSYLSLTQAKEQLIKLISEPDTYRELLGEDGLVRIKKINSGEKLIAKQDAMELLNEVRAQVANYNHYNLNSEYGLSQPKLVDPRQHAFSMQNLINLGISNISSKTIDPQLIKDGQIEVYGIKSNDILTESELRREIEDVVNNGEYNITFGITENNLKKIESFALAQIRIYQHDFLSGKTISKTDFENDKKILSNEVRILLEQYMSGADLAVEYGMELDTENKIYLDGLVSLKDAGNRLQEMIDKYPFRVEFELDKENDKEIEELQKEDGVTRTDNEFKVNASIVNFASEHVIQKINSRFGGKQNLDPRSFFAEIAIYRSEFDEIIKRALAGDRDYLYDAGIVTTIKESQSKTEKEIDNSFEDLVYSARSNTSFGISEGNLKRIEEYVKGKIIEDAKRDLDEYGSYERNERELLEQSAVKFKDLSSSILSAYFDNPELLKEIGIELDSPRETVDSVFQSRIEAEKALEKLSDDFRVCNRISVRI